MMKPLRAWHAGHGPHPFAAVSSASAARSSRSGLALAASELARARSSAIRLSRSRKPKFLKPRNTSSQAAGQPRRGDVTVRRAIGVPKLQAVRNAARDVELPRMHRAMVGRAQDDEPVRIVLPAF